jgi:hypothetical protein
VSIGHREKDSIFSSDKYNRLFFIKKRKMLSLSSSFARFYFYSNVNC